MIADLDETIRQMLIADLPVKNGEIDIKFDQPKREWSAKLTKPTINLFLYDVRENLDLRRAGYEQMPNGNMQQSLARMKKAPHRVDCFYMLTTWAAEPEDEHRLLTRTLMSLFRNPILPAHHLVGTLQNPRYDIQTYVARPDRLTNPAEVWSSLDNEIRPSIPYLITLTLDPWTEVTGPIVKTFTIRSGQTRTLPTFRRLDEDGFSTELTTIGGTVRSKSKDKEPMAGLEVAIKGTGWVGTTDEKGRFILGGMPPGEYTLVIWAAKGKPSERKISVPPANGDFDIEL